MSTDTPSNAPQPAVRHSIRITGMADVAALRRVEEGLLALEGVSEVSMNFRKGEATVAGDPEQLDPSALVTALEAMGFGASIMGPGDDAYRIDVTREELDAAEKRFRLAWAWTGPIGALTLLHLSGLWQPPYGTWLAIALALPVLAVAGRDTMATALNNLRARTPGPDTPVVLAILVAFATGPLHLAGVDVASFTALSAMLMACYLTGRHFDTRARGDVSRTIRTALECETEPLGDPHLTHAAVELRDAQSAQPPIQVLAGQLTALFVPLVVGLAAFAALLWLTVPGMMLALGGWAAPWLPWSLEGDVWPASRAIFAALAVLAVACPRALGLAVPAAVMAGTAAAAGRGLRIRDGVIIHRLKKLTILCFDKTGTLTRGQLKVAAVEVLDGVGPRDLLTWAAGVSLFSDHPIDRAIAEKATRDHCDMLPAGDFDAVPGMGVRAEVDGAKVLVGKPAFLAASGVDTKPIEHVVYRMQREGKTAVAVARAGRVIGVLGISDTLRPESVRATKILKRMGLKCILITGDSKATAEVIADQCGIERVIADVLPQARAKAVANLKQETIGAVGMVGDGIHDAGALAAVDVGIALGTGTDSAIDAADVALMKGDLMALVEVVQLGRATYDKIVQNLFWAFGYNLVFVPLAMVGLLHPVIAAICMALSSLNVIGNSLRLRKFDAGKVTREVMRR